MEYEEEYAVGKMSEHEAEFESAKKRTLLQLLTQLQNEVEDYDWTLASEVANSILLELQKK